MKANDESTELTEQDFEELMAEFSTHDVPKSDSHPHVMWWRKKEFPEKLDWRDHNILTPVRY